MNEAKFQEIITLIPRMRNDLLRRVPFELQGLVGLEMGFKAAGNKEKNRTKTLNVRSGRLFRSFTPNGRDNINEKTADGLKYGSRVQYAAIHEYGGTIQHPGTGNGFGKGIPIPAHPIPMGARPYFNPALKKFESDVLPELVEKAFEPLIEAFK